MKTDAAATTETRAVRIHPRTGGGTPISGVLMTPPGPAWKSAVVVVADRDRDADHGVAVCQALATAGHGALALDLNLAGLEGAREGASPAALALRRLTDEVAAGVSFVRSAGPAPSRLGVLGYGAGGFVALAAGYRCQVGAAVSFYGEGPQCLRANLKQIIDKPKRHAANLLCLVGGEDPEVRPRDLAAIREHLDAFGMRHTLIVYPRTRAGFCHPDSPTYRAAEANDAWQKVLRAFETAPRLRHRFEAAAPTRERRSRPPPKPDAATPSARRI
jgi:carboxymethylenebutenolidase